MTLEEALERIKELEREVIDLRTENALLRNRNFGGRKKHDETWRTSYYGFLAKYLGGMSLRDIVAEGEVSRRTAYRYLAYYREMQEREGEEGT